MKKSRVTRRRHEKEAKKEQKGLTIVRYFYYGIAGARHVLALIFPDFFQ